MPADTPLAVDKDGYQKTAEDLLDLIKDLQGFADKFKDLAQLLTEDNSKLGQVRADAELAYRDLATLIELAMRLGRPR